MLHAYARGKPTINDIPGHSIKAPGQNLSKSGGIARSRYEVGVFQLPSIQVQGEHLKWQAKMADEAWLTKPHDSKRFSFSFCNLHIAWIILK